MVLILAHEWGHFSVAKFFGIRVDEFGIGFPPRILSVQKGETVYSLNLLLLGGFVRIFGEDTSALVEPRSFASKNRGIQAAVLLAGIVCNILFAWLLFSVGYMVGMPTSAQHVGFGQVQNARVEITGVLPDSPAKRSGILPGDTLVALETANASLRVDPSVETGNASAVQHFIVANQEKSIVLTLSRDGVEKIVLAKPADGVIAGHKALGIALDDTGVLRLPVHLALLQGALMTKDTTVATAEGLMTFFGKLLHGAGGWDGVSGPIGIANIGAGAVRAGVVATITIAALISINLAIINLLPIPGLDGGRLLFVAIEAIIRRPLPARLSTWVSLAGFVLLIGLMLVASVHDIVTLVHPA